MEMPTSIGVAQKKLAVLASFHENRRTVDFARLRKNADAQTTSTCCLRKFKSYLFREELPNWISSRRFFFLSSLVAAVAVTPWFE